MALAEGAAGGLADHREGLRKELVERLATGDTGPEGGGLVAQGIILERRHLAFQGIDLDDRRSILLDLAVIRVAENLGGKRAQAEHEAFPW